MANRIATQCDMTLEMSGAIFLATLAQGLLEELGGAVGQPDGRPCTTREIAVEITLPIVITGTLGEIGPKRPRICTERWPIADDDYSLRSGWARPTARPPPQA